ncbi:sulfatase-like hydrolase/transferase, partial [Pseudomonas aeruginosa]|uniref:sulfatase-like hydrolase/transferase n=1 Tax=Pseudomonas aeruginosa TaxID=287 RepID=UPI00345A6DC7
LDALAASGMLFTQFYAHASCSPTRAMLLSGTDNHNAGIGMMNPTNNEFRGGYDALLRRDVAALPEVLGAVGYTTIMAGKWHLGEEEGYRPHER